MSTTIADVATFAVVAVVAEPAVVAELAVFAFSAYVEYEDDMEEDAFVELEAYEALIEFEANDALIEFDAGPHKYTCAGEANYTSVTTWNHSHFKEFNADRIIDRMMNSKNWVNSEYYGMSKEEIKNKWNKNRDEAAEAGTKMHYDIECYYNNVKVNNNSKKQPFLLELAVFLFHYKLYNYTNQIFLKVRLSCFPIKATCGKIQTV